MDALIPAVQRMRIDKTTRWMLGAFGVGAAVAIAIRLSFGPTERMSTALQATARWAFVFFWLATTADPLATLFGAAFTPLARRARDLGLAFAAALAVHLGLVVWMFCVSRPDISAASLAFLGLGAGVTYLLAASSFRPIAALLGARPVRWARSIGVQYLTLVFFVDFDKDPLGGGVLRAAYYAPFVLLTVAGPLLRLAAAVVKRLQHRPSVAI